MRLAILFTQLLACAVSTPEPLNAEVAAPEGSGHASIIVVEEWSLRLEAWDLNASDMPPVRWFEGPCLDYGGQIVPKHDCVTGFFESDGGGEIHVAMLESIHSSALAHEALHWSLQQHTGCSNSDHDWPIWSAVGEVQDVLHMAGL